MENRNVDFVGIVLPISENERLPSSFLFPPFIFQFFQAFHRGVLLFIVRTKFVWRLWSSLTAGALSISPLPPSALLNSAQRVSGKFRPPWKHHKSVSFIPVRFCSSLLNIPELFTFRRSRLTRIPKPTSLIYGKLISNNSVIVWNSSNPERWLAGGFSVLSIMSLRFSLLNSSIHCYECIIILQNFIEIIWLIRKRFF